MLTEQQKSSILATVPILREGGVALTKHFYQRMLTNHPELKNLFNLGNQQNGKQPTALALSVLAYAEHIADPSVLSGALNTIGHKHTSLNVTPEQYAIVGENLLASIQEVLGPEVATPEIVDAWATAYQQLADLMIGVERKMYEAKKAEAGNWVGWRQFMVKNKVQESDEITSFYLYPTDEQPVALHHPGQYLSVRVYIPELHLLQPRQYSISSAPNQTHYRISVKREVGTAEQPAGLVSNHLIEQIHEGDSIEVSAPAGNFIAKKNAKHHVFIGGGIGVTPLFSMLSDIIGKDTDTPITWIQGFRSPEVQPFGKKLEQWSQKAANLAIHTFYEQPPATLSEHTYSGTLNLNRLNNFETTGDANYYICGPKAFIETHVDQLKQKGVSPEQIAFEQFGPHTLGF